jgi:hypothetical protein
MTALSSELPARNTLARLDLRQLGLERRDLRGWGGRSEVVQVVPASDEGEESDRKVRLKSASDGG